jgi:homogentisate 1,2-dioxygenase
MFETRLPLRPTAFALKSPQLQRDYYQCWQGIQKNFRKNIE